jgi:hypothetical protein
MLMELQWTNLWRGATLQCNVDREGMIPKSGYRFSDQIMPKPIEGRPA